MIKYTISVELLPKLYTTYLNHDVPYVDRFVSLRITAFLRSAMSSSFYILFTCLDVVDVDKCLETYTCKLRKKQTHYRNMSFR